MSDEFDWKDPDVVLVPQQDAIAVYTNPKDGVVIRQQSDMGEDDHFVYIHRHHLPALIAKLQTYLVE